MTRTWLSSIVIASVALFGCNGTEQEQREIQRQLEGFYNQVVQNKDVPLSELQKLSQLEYNVITLPLDSSPEKIAGTLNALGRKRWDCFHVEQQTRRLESGKAEQNLMFICKRGPETALRYIPRNLIGR